MPRRRLTCSALVERVANQAQACSESECERAAAEAISLLTAGQTLQTIDEMRKALAVVCAQTVGASALEVVHAGTAAAVQEAARCVLMASFGKCSGAEVEEAILGAACNQTDRSFMVARVGDDGAVAAAGVLVEHRFRRADGSPAVTWELLWLACPEAGRGAGAGAAAWAAIGRLAAARGVDGLLVPSTDAALLFWARRATPECPMSKIVLREEPEDDASGDGDDWIAKSASIQKKGQGDRVRRLFARHGLAIAASPWATKAAAALKPLYAPRLATANLAPPTNGRKRSKGARKGVVCLPKFEAEPNRWSPRAATHVWFFPGASARAPPKLPLVTDSSEAPVAPVAPVAPAPIEVAEVEFEVLASLKPQPKVRGRSDSFLGERRPRADSVIDDEVVGG